MNDDKDFIDLDSTQNWSKLDVTREIDNVEVNKETGEKYDFARGFTGDKKESEQEAVLLDGLTSGLNYIPEEFLAAADEKHEIEREKSAKEEKPDVSWAYRTETESKDDEPFVALADIKKAEAEAEKLRAVEAKAALKIAEEAEEEKMRAAELLTAKKPEVTVTAEPVKKPETTVAAEPAKKAEAVAAVETAAVAEAVKDAAEDVEAIRQKNLEAQIKKHNEINASDEAVAANIEARKKAREEAAAAREAAIREGLEARKEAQRKAEEELFKEDLEFLDFDAPTSTKEERIAAAKKNGNSGLEENEYPTAAQKAAEAAEAAIVAEAVGSVVEGAEAAATEKAVEIAAENGEGVEAVAESVGVVAEGAEIVTEAVEGAVAAEATTEAVEGAVKKKKKKTTAAEDYAAWADGDMRNFEEMETKKKRKKKKVEEEITEEELEEEDDGYYYGFFGNIIHFFKKMTLLDILVACTGVLVVIVAVITLMVYSSSKATQNKIAEFVPLGSNMQTLGLVGSGVFEQIVDARNTVPVIEEPEEEEEEEAPKEYDEKDDESTISVTMSLTSVKKDLKIKFINAKTKKLVGNHEFKVDIEDAKGKKYSAKDDDMDGIIYLNSVAPGKAKVSMAELPKDKGITFSKEPVTINIKENLDFKKIDVSDEVKTESQINAKAEDTALGNATEGALKDTVEWVESTKVEIDGGYVKIEKSAITDPAKVTPTAAAQVSKFGVTNAVVANKFFASGRILVATNNDDGDGTGDGGDGGSTGGDGGSTEPPVEPPKKEDPVPTEPLVTIVPTEAPEEPLVTVAPTEAPAVTPEVIVTPEVTATPAVTAGPSPTVNPKEDTTTPLKDNKGNQVYLKNADGSYVEAKVADYYKKNLVYYRKAAEGENAKYTGWQTIGNDTFYFDKNGNYVTGEQVIQGAKYNFDSKGALVKGSGVMGIDVSKWNGNINWQAVKNSGVSFVIIRCGYRGSSTGALVEDPKFKTNIKGATDAGLKVGVYFFSQAISDVEAVEEASMTIDLIKKYKISYPVFLDVEDSNGRGDKIDSNTRTAVISAFCQTMKNSGYTAGVYANKSWLTGKMNAGALGNYKIWLAQYNTEITYTGKVDMWQYSSKGSVSGISGNTDMNLSYLGY